MSKKTRRQKKRARQAPSPQQPWRPDQEDPGAQQRVVNPAPQAQAAPRPAAVPAYAARVTGPRRQPAQVAAATIDIDARVPHFASDLQRIALTAGTMILLIIVISFFIK